MASVLPQAYDALARPATVVGNSKTNSAQAIRFGNGILNLGKEPGALAYRQHRFRPVGGQLHLEGI